MRFCVGSGQSGHTWPSVRHSLVPWDRSIVNPFHSDIASCPGIWKSKLQDCIAVSTGHAEYIALSLALCQVLPFYCLVREAIATGIVCFEDVPSNQNMSDFLTKSLPHYIAKDHVNPLLFWKGETEFDLCKVSGEYQNEMDS